MFNPDFEAERCRGYMGFRVWETQIGNSASSSVQCLMSESHKSRARCPLVSDIITYAKLSIQDVMITAQL